MKYPKMREIKEAITSLFTPAYTSRFPKEPHIPFENFRGKPVVDNENCVGCETCANVCPPQAITFIDDKEKELLICESCNAVITTKEHLHFMHRKLGSKAFSSILNLNLLNQKLKLAEGQDLGIEIRDGLKRKDMFNIICPNCLRLILVKYLYRDV